MNLATHLVRLLVCACLGVELLSVVTVASAADLVHFTEVDVKVAHEGASTYSTYCVPRLASAATTRRLAVAGAARAIVQSRYGVVVTGREFLQHGRFEERIQEDTFGIVGALDVISEDQVGGIAHDQWCVKVEEVERR